MPAAAIGVGASLAGSAVAAAVTSYTLSGALAAGIGATLSYAAVSIGVSSAISAVGQSLLGGGAEERRAAQQQAPVAQAARGVILNTAGTADPLPVIYGRRRIGGTRCLLEVSGDSNEYLHLVVAHCEGEIAGVDALYLDQTAVSDARFAGLVSSESSSGTDGQAASAALMTALPGVWTADHTLSGVAYSYVRLTFSQEAFSGLPTLAADVRGRKVYDPRDATVKYSNNPALCLRDYLINARFGRGLPESDIDDASFIAAANICDETITLPDGSSAPRHTCNIILNTDAAALDNVEAILNTCRGMLIHTGGRYRLTLDVATAPAHSFTTDNITGGWRIALGEKRGRYNRVRAAWTDPAREWQPAIHVADSAAFRSDDNGLMLEAQLDLTGTTSAYEAQLLAGRFLRQSRFGISVQFTATLAGLTAECGDVISITHDTPGWTAKPFRVTNIALLNHDEVQITAREYDAAVYADDPLTAPASAPVTHLPDPFTVAAPGNPAVTETLYSTRDGAGVKARADVSWAASADAYVTGYELQHRAQGASAWQTVPAGQALSASVPDIAPGWHEFRVRAVNSIGASATSGVTTAEIRGLLDPPQEPQGLTLSTIGGLAVLRWDAAADLDVRQGGFIEFCHSAASSGATWGTATSIGDRVAGSETVAVLPLLAGTYLAKTVDSSGIYSSSAASVVTDGATVLAFAALDALQEDAGFSGAHSGTVRDDTVTPAPVLKLDGATLLDAWGDVDDAAMWDSEGGVSASGVYTFAGGFDFGALTRARVSKTITAAVVNAADIWDARTALLDAWDDVDGASGNEADATLWARSTPDDPAGSPVWSAWQRLDTAEYHARALQFQARLVSYQPTHNIHISALGATAEQIA